MLAMTDQILSQRILIPSSYLPATQGPLWERLPGGSHHQGLTISPEDLHLLHAEGCPIRTTLSSTGRITRVRASGVATNKAVITMGNTTTEAPRGPTTMAKVITTRDGPRTTDHKSPEVEGIIEEGIRAETPGIRADMGDINPIACFYQERRMNQT
ncbi:hypothetical protein P175DRAFT_0156862 [Aspergillus ochraceoroseus IBT 24754]|uniref:Uncharacterized protein n=1 Tax=Aspergillus ochraceoroseus IBT 24754 TaxID=1392256 RepID=A0A2T5M3G0_9EURO|nr:uncharacterized protein P175DRAFT_0156862 [Aspergillus ochraceoroseus IBT 24754]PTU23078.1 hypothetical protein P175DRAFT_0156862 [Aspergillus ochraceoroseus IBT 24754]